MPVVLDRLPLPNLTWYTGVSILLLTFSIYYAGVQVNMNPNWRLKFISEPEALTAVKDEGKRSLKSYEAQLDFSTTDKDIVPQKISSSRKVHFESTKIVSYREESESGNTDCALETGFHISSLDDKELLNMNDKSEKKNSKLQENKYDEGISKVSIADTDHKPDKEDNVTLQSSETGYFDVSPYIIPEIISFMFHEPLCIWTLINMAYCVLILLGTTIQRLVFGELRVSEQQHIKDKFWNFVFYKFVFVFGVMNVQEMGEGILWCSWFSVLGFLHLLAQLCKDRFEYLSFSPTTPKRTHFRLLGLLSIILFLATSCLMISIFVGFHAGINTFAFMLAECVLLMIRTLYVIARYSIYLWDISHEGLWEKRGRYIYWTELVFELSELAIDMVHHMHMLVWANMLLTMASLVICMQLRLLFYQLQHKIKSHKNYLRVVRLIKRYAEVRGIDLASGEDTCAICWEIVEVGRLLNCNHVFHSSCLLAWLHQDLSCPTCRHRLSHPEKEIIDRPGILSNLLPTGIEGEEGESMENENGSGTFPSPASDGMAGNNGWRYVSWLPSFSVEQSHTQLPRHHQVNSQPVTTSQLDNLARQVRQMFPDVSYAHILEDLRRTRSIEDTIDNILEHRLVMPPPMFSQDIGSNIPMNYSSDRAEEPITEEAIQGSSLEVQYKLSSLALLLEEEDAPVRESSSESDSESFDARDSNVPGGYFSKSAHERERVLSQRKEQLLSRARQRFLSKMPRSSSETSDASKKLLLNRESSA